MSTMTCAIPSAVSRALRRHALPLAWYYAVTLAIPIANGAAEAGMVFVWHALAVLVVPLFLIVVASGTRGMARAITAGWHRNYRGT